MIEIFRRILQNPDYWKRLNPFQIRSKLLEQFPDLPNESCAVISESIELSHRLQEKNFVYDIWLGSIQTFEQATNFQLTQFHAQLFNQKSGHILDACGGLGFDAVGFIRQGLNVTTCEINPMSAEKLTVNKELYSIDTWKIKPTSCLDETPKPYTGIFIDPMRRVNNRRMVKIDDYSPAVSDLTVFLDSGLPVIIKTSPLLTLTDELKAKFQIVYVSHNFECKEILLCKNLKTIGQQSVYISESDKLFNIQDYEESWNPSVPENSRFIYDPNPALMKSGGVDFLASQYDINRPDQFFGYFFGNNETVEHLFARYHLIDCHYYKINKLSELTAGFNGEIILKKKNSSIDLERIKLRKRKISEKTILVIFITERDGETVFWMGRPI